VPQRAAAPGDKGPGTIVFCHANGFPAGTYRRLFETWRAAGWRVAAPDKFGHDPAYPVTSNWPRLRDQLIDFIEAASPGQPVHLVGHSLGGYLALLAACKRPALARSLVLIDSPIVTGWRAHSVQVMKLGGIFKRVSPGRISAGRRYGWPSAADAHQHFAGKQGFARWAPGVLQDYIACGIEPAADGGVTLAFRRDVETHIYNTLPHHMGRVLRRHPPRCPVSFIAGTRSAENRRAGLAATRALTHGRIEWIEGTHLFPMERPLETAQAVLRALAAGAEAS
jgi:pimeloyl-ACP methyl ester carboxylesterase